MQYLRYTGYGLGGLIICLVIVGLTLPGKTRVERTVSINATTDDVFAAIDSFQQFNTWSPWAKIDPNTQYTFEGPERGVGARMTWSSDNPDVGSGKSEVVAFEPNKNVTVALDFGSEGNAVYDLNLIPDGGSTNVTWGFDVDFGMNLIARYFGLFMDGMVGDSYEEGLATLKSQVEEQVALREMQQPVADSDPSQTESATTGIPTGEPMPAFAEN